MQESMYASRLGGRNIRVIELFPGEPGGPIVCDLREVSLDNLPSYKAISYVWGNANVREPICCNGHTAEITVSLAQALRRLRRHDSSCLLWADALCMNQNDTTERNHQVQLMGDVYSKATKVVVWLGPDDYNNAATAVAAFNLVQTSFEKYRKHIKKPEELNDPIIGDLDKILVSLGRHNCWNAIETFFKRQWWKRVWCVQEIVLAKRAIFMCGNEEVDWRTIGVFSIWYYVQRRLHRNPKPKEANSDGINKAYERFHDHSIRNNDLLDILAKYGGLQASEKRDNIYALLGIANRNLNQYFNIEVDYNKSVQEVYIDAVLHSMKPEYPLRFLLFVDHNNTYEPTLDFFPSWVPRWDIRRQVSRLGRVSPNLSTNHFDVPVDWEFAYSGFLRLEGVFLDTVKRTHDVLGQENGSFFHQDQRSRQLFLMLVRQATGGLDKLVQTERSTILRLATTFTGGFMTRFPRAYIDDCTSDIEKQYISDFMAFVQTLAPEEEIVVPGSEHTVGDAQNFDYLAIIACWNRRVFFTNRGFIGVGPRCMKMGDIVVTLDGCLSPCILRPLNDSEYAFMGTCYVYDIARNEIISMLGKDGVERRHFTLR